MGQYGLFLLRQYYISTIYRYYIDEDVSEAIRCIDDCLVLRNLMEFNSDCEIPKWTETQAKCMILLGRITERISLNDAVMIYENIERVCSRSEDTVVFKYESMILRVNVLKLQNLSSGSRRNGISYEAIKASRKFGLPIIESFICKEVLQDLFM